MTEARFSFTRKVNNDLVTVRGDSGVEFRANYVFAFGEESWDRTFGPLSGEGAVAQTEAAAIEAVKEAFGTSDVVAPPPAQPTPPGFDAPDPSDTRSEAGSSTLSAAQQAALAKLKGGEAE